MKTNYSIILLFALICTLPVFGSEPKAEVKRVNAVIVHEYLRNNSYYCSMNSYIVYDNDTIPFIQHAYANAKFLRENPELQKIARDSRAYIDQFNEMFPKPDYKIDLSYSRYNLHTHDLGVFLAVHSLSFFS